METKILKVVELGGKYENQYVVSTFGALANVKCEDGCLVAATLRFQTHEHNGAEYQDIVATEVIPL